jgi:hypothetical protein
MIEKSEDILIADMMAQVKELTRIVDQQERQIEALKAYIIDFAKRKGIALHEQKEIIQKV